MPVAAVVIWMVGFILADGLDLGGVGNLLVGVSALLVAGTGVRSNRKLTQVQGTVNKVEGAATTAAAAATDAKVLSAEAVVSLGPSNGADVLTSLSQIGTVLAEIKTFEEYQHGRNHDILNALTVIRAAVPMLLTSLERLVEILERREGDEPSTST